MPNSFAGLAQRFPAEKEGQSLEEQVRELRDYSYQLLEYLRYALQNLEPSNFNETEMEKWTNQITEPVYGEIRDANGNIAKMQLTAEAFATQLENAEGNISQLVQTAEGFQTTVESLDGKYSKLQQTVNGFDFTGMVTFDDLTDEDTTISGDCITTGTISLKRLDLSNSYGSLEIASGSTGVYGTKGPCLTGPEDSIYLIVTNAACRMTAIDPDDEEIENNFYVSPTRTHADVECDCVSDARQKNSIAHDVAERYGAMYRALQPVRFKFNNGTSDRYHTGFIAQEVEQALAGCGLTTQDLAALICDKNGKYSIRYGELIALNTAMIQKLMDENDALKARVAALEGGNDAT